MQNALRQHLNEFMPDLDMALDPGIREIVLILRSEGIETIESCQGGEGHCSPEPMVRFNGNAFEGYRAFAIAKSHGFNVLSIAYECGESDGWLETPYWKMTLRNTKRSGGASSHGEEP